MFPDCGGPASPLSIRTWSWAGHDERLPINCSPDKVIWKNNRLGYRRLATAGAQSRAIGSCSVVELALVACTANAICEMLHVALRLTGHCDPKGTREGEGLPLPASRCLAGPLLREVPQRPESESAAGSAVTG
jgi:hypothetical protein